MLNKICKSIPINVTIYKAIQAMPDLKWKH